MTALVSAGLLREVAVAAVRSVCSEQARRGWRTRRRNTRDMVVRAIEGTRGMFGSLGWFGLGSEPLEPDREDLLDEPGRLVLPAQRDGPA